MNEYTTVRIQRNIMRKIKKKVADKDRSTIQDEINELLLIGLKNKYICGDKNE